MIGKVGIISFIKYSYKNSVFKKKNQNHKYLNLLVFTNKNVFYYFILECNILDSNNHVKSLIVAICLIGIATIFVLFLIVVLKVFKHNTR